jgi:uncharacterized surface protein with fasciclin (FAS1) repeats
MIYKVSKTAKGQKELLFIICSLLFSVALTSCSDEWNDHYEEATTAGGTLWQTIKDNSSLENFASVLEACGYNTVLDGSQTFTVFAPTNTALSTSETNELIASFRSQQEAGVRTSENTVIRRFIMNHIAQYRYPVSSLTNQTITLMNDKYAKLTSMQLGRNSLTEKNTLCDNGLLFTMDSKLDYVPNVLETLDMEEGLDSVYSFLSSHNTYEFVEAQSVPGEIIDGMTHYMDSVTVLTNDLLSKYGRIDLEDSTYWFIAPTNTVWDELVEEYTPYFNYPRNVLKRDSMQYTNTRLAIIGGGFFSRTVNSDVAFRDSAVSTQALTNEQRRLLGITDNYYVYQHPFDEGGVFYGTTEIACSNGQVRKASSATISKYLTFMQDISVEAENISSQDTLINAIDPLTIVQVASNNKFYGKVSGDSYVEVNPVNPSARVAVGFKIPDLLSGVKYNIYAVFAPATAGDSLAIAETEKPLRVLSRIRQADQNGVISSPPFRYAKSVDGTTVNEVLLQSNVSLTTCSWGLATPTVRLELQSNTDGATLRIDRIIFRCAKE